MYQQLPVWSQPEGSQRVPTHTGSHIFSDRVWIWSWPNPFPVCLLVVLLCAEARLLITALQLHQQHEALLHPTMFPSMFLHLCHLYSHLCSKKKPMRIPVSIYVTKMSVCLKGGFHLFYSSKSVDMSWEALSACDCCPREGLTGLRK